MFISPIQLFNDITFQPQQQVIVISDAQYSEYQKAEAQRELDVLQKRAENYEKTLASINATMDALRIKAGLIEPAASSQDKDDKS